MSSAAAPPLVTRSFAALVCSFAWIALIAVVVDVATRLFGKLEKKDKEDAAQVTAPERLSTKRVSILSAVFAAAAVTLWFISPYVSPKEFDAYAVLGLSSGASEREVMSAYRRLSLTYHPDKSTGDKDKFRSIVRAYESITDPVSRQNYENFGNPEGVASEEKFGDTDSMSAEAQTGFLGMYAAAIFVVTVSVIVFRRSAGGESGYDFVSAALSLLDRVPALRDEDCGVLECAKPNATAPKPTPVDFPPLTTEAFVGKFGPLFKKVRTAEPLPQLNVNSTPDEVKLFYAAWRNADTKLVKESSLITFERSLSNVQFTDAKMKIVGGPRLTELKADKDAWKKFQQDNWLLEPFGTQVRFKSDQIRLNVLLKSAEAADPRLKTAAPAI